MTGLFGEFQISENNSVFQNCTIGLLFLHSPFFIFMITKILLHSPTFHPHLGLTSLFPVLCINISHFFITVLFLFAEKLLLVFIQVVFLLVVRCFVLKLFLRGDLFFQQIIGYLASC